MLYDGSYHEVDSSELTFKIAGIMAFHDAARKAEPVLLAPVMRVEVVAPAECAEGVMGNLSGRRGRILSQEDRDGMQRIDAQVPLAEMFGYARDLGPSSGFVRSTCSGNSAAHAERACGAVSRCRHASCGPAEPVAVRGWCVPFGSPPGPPGARPRAIRRTGVRCDRRDARSGGRASPCRSWRRRDAVPAAGS